MIAPEVLVARLAELAVAPLAFALAAGHLARAGGPGRAASEVAVLSLYGFTVERLGVGWFDLYRYGHGFRLAPFGVPVAVALTWCAVLVAVEALAAARADGAVARAALATALGVLLDASMEGVARAAGLWSWSPSGDVFGAPLGNFVGWACVVFPWVALRQRRASPLVAGAAGTAVVLAVGEAWARLGLEGHLHRAGPYLLGAVAAGLVAAGIAPSPARRPPALALLAYLVLLCGFAGFAAVLGRPDLIATSAALAVTVGLALIRRRRARVPEPSPAADRTAAVDG